MSKDTSKAAIIKDYQINKNDTGSSEVQIALLSDRIAHLTDHLRVHNKDIHTRRGLLMLASRRRKLLDYLKRTNLKSYNEIVTRLGLRR